MPLIVQKFGGTSVADSQKILAAARKAIRAQQQGHQVLVVVSAMGHQTDELIELAAQITDRPSAREMDMLLSTGEQVSVALVAMAIHALGSDAVSLTGAQIGIRTDSRHTKARIQSISTERVRRLLDDNKIVIAAGFQGIDEEGNITTLGRGGSDTTAVALAAVLGADACEIYTDVEGVFTTDPRVLPEARKVRQISYDEMLELASLGAGVMHSRSIEFGKKFGVPIHVRSSFADVPGTVIAAHSESLEQPVCGAALARSEARVTVHGVPDRPGTSLAVFSRIAARHIAVDMIVQNVGAGGKADLSFTVPKDELDITLEAVREAIREIGADGVSHDDNVSKISVVGLGMATQTGVAHRMFRALADAGINLVMITTSEIKISVLVARDQAQGALRAVHRAFALHTEPPATPAPAGGAAGGKPSSALEVVKRLQGMEDLTITDLTLDEKQARLTLASVPDRPGIAATVFERIAGQGILVDMIVQSCGQAGRANLSWTVPSADERRAVEVARELTRELGGGSVASSPRVAKLSVEGVGIRSHTGVAIRMFQALAAAGINLDMISTSEVRVNVVVEGEQGAAAFQRLESAFAETRP